MLLLLGISFSFLSDFSTLSHWLSPKQYTALLGAKAGHGLRWADASEPSHAVLEANGLLRTSHCKHTPTLSVDVLPLSFRSTQRQGGSKRVGVVFPYESAFLFPIFLQFGLPDWMYCPD